MNVFNRIVTVLAILLVWAAIVLLAAVPEQALTWARAGLDWIEQWMVVLAGLSFSWLYPLLRVSTIVLTTGIMVILLWQELHRRVTPAVRVQLQSGGEASVTADSVARRLAWHIDQLADVISVDPRVEARGNSVDIHLELETAPDVEVPMKTEEVMAITREIIDQQMGLQLRKLKVDIRHAPYPEPL